VQSRYLLDPSVQVAVKKVPFSTDEEKLVSLREVHFLAQLNHPNVVQFMRAIERPVSRELWIVMEYMKGGTLAQAVSP